MIDYVQEWADEQYEELRIAIIELYDEVGEKTGPMIEAYMKKHEPAVKKQQARLEAGDLTEEQYRLWLKKELLETAEWKKLQKKIVKLYSDADELVAEMTNEAIEAVYEQAYTRSCYEIEASWNGY